MTTAPFSVSERVRWADVDLVGIMRYDAYTRFLDVAESDMLRSVGLSVPKIAERYDVWLPRKVLHVDYHAPARLDDLLAVRAWIGHVGTSSIKLKFEIADAETGAPRASAHFFLVCVGRADLQKRPLPAEVVLLLRPYVTGE
ncbi:MAG TPA: thioesterase family protein [Gemmatimonadaceae bacterium]|nr:thioesterase family protein [Gemmatimonadaceae bacterium]